MKQGIKNGYIWYKKILRKCNSLRIFLFDYRDFSVRRPPPRTMFTRASITANMRAVQKPVRLNPGTISATSRTIRTLMMRDTRPSVNILSGSVSILRTGPIVLLTTARTTATMIAVIYPSTVAQGVTYAAIATARADIRRFTRKLILYKLLDKVGVFYFILI